MQFSYRHDCCKANADVCKDDTGTFVAYWHGSCNRTKVERKALTFLQRATHTPLTTTNEHGRPPSPTVAHYDTAVTVADTGCHERQGADQGVPSWRKESPRLFCCLEEFLMKSHCFSY